MNLTTLNYDQCTYRHDLKQSVAPADYQIGAPRNECNACFPIDPRVQMGSGYAGGTGGEFGGAVCENKPLIDVSSELRNMTRKASNCPSDKYIPGQPYCNLRNIPDCQSMRQSSEDTRLNNPPCTLRSTGWNRWEWLCKNPQDKALIPFDFNISNRIVVKDNHRPCIPVPLSFAPSLPPLNYSDDVYKYEFVCQQPIKEIPSTHWRKCDSYAGYA